MANLKKLHPTAFLSIAYVFLLPFLIGSCQPNHYRLFNYNNDDIEYVNLIEKTTHATDDLLSNCSAVWDKKQSVIVTSLVNIDDIQRSSTYGRMSSEIIASKMAQKGYNVKEVKLTQSDIFVQQNKGEFALSRELKEIAHKHDIQSLVVGTYALGYQKVHISLRVVRTHDNRIICAYPYEINQGKNMNLWR